VGTTRRNDLSFHPTMLIGAARAGARVSVAGWALPSAATAFGRVVTMLATCLAPIRINRARIGSSEEDVVLKHALLGMVVLDIPKGDRLGGIEFLD
jgi:hypothetical protein